MGPIRRGSALIIANAIIFVVAAIAMFVLEKILPVAEGTRGVENSNMAYYRAQEGAEAALMQLSRNDAFVVPTASGGTRAVGYSAVTHALTPVIPSPGEGNSDYDQDWNKIGANDPVQLVLAPNVDWSNVRVFVRVPNLDGDASTDETLSGAYYATSSGVIAWALTSGNGNFLNPMDESNTLRYVAPGTSGDVFSSTSSGSVTLHLRQGRNQDAVTGVQFSAFYAGTTAAGAGSCASVSCTLRLSTLRPLLTASGQVIPYLEYKLDFSNAQNPGPGPVDMPDRYVRIASQGDVYGFRRDVEKKVPQTTAVQGLDVTVFN